MCDSCERLVKRFYSSMCILNDKMHVFIGNCFAVPCLNGGK